MRGLVYEPHPIAIHRRNLLPNGGCPNMSVKYLALLILLPLFGCAGITVYHSRPVGSPYQFSDVESAARAGAISAEVTGKLAGHFGSQFHERVRGLMSGTFNGIPVRFVTGEASPKVRIYRVVVWFNPSSRRENLDLCSYKGGVTARPDPQRLEVAMAFCNGQTLLSKSSGVFFFFNVDPVETNKFTSLIRTATAALFPPQGTEEGREFRQRL